jgi:hypothetical protein
MQNRIFLALRGSLGMPLGRFVVRTSTPPRHRSLPGDLAPLVVNVLLSCVFLSGGSSNVP